MKRSQLKRKPTWKKLRRGSARLKKTKLATYSKSIIRKLEKKLWRLLSDYIRQRDKWTCITCGKTEWGRKMHAGHLISRKRKNTLFDPKNIHAQCSWCNLFKYGDTANYSQKFIVLYGLDEFNNLLERARKDRQWTEKELLFLISVLKEGKNYEEVYKTYESTATSPKKNRDSGIAK